MKFSSATFSVLAFVTHSAAAFGPAASSGSRTFTRATAALQMAAKLPIMAPEEAMSAKAHGTSEKPVMTDLRWNCDYDTADRICNFNRHYAEHAGYWASTEFLKYVKGRADQETPIDYYDSVTGERLFTAPVGRSMQDYLNESNSHGWPSFRDEEVNWDYVRCLDNGECISTSGTHLGHNLPDKTGNRYCINLVSVAGQEKKE
eukprot:CAMPEP_0119012774 /NCGR_PEP_ID=MMETSP1176-20130426/7533_1 /TAXON_ID=265551 /ORGANISM="Synedropsis recta cf, Strain CCMP1620" /LENGTH=202 /DNA_ID=CAMNT_0006965797 /DNA_START=89 /DNA_END=697 /DNA_ORIENTATION=+